MMIDDQNINFTPRLQKVLQICKQTAVELGSTEAKPEHLFISFFKLKNFRSVEILYDAGFNEELFNLHLNKSLIKKIKKVNDVNPEEVVVSANLKKIIQNAITIAKDLGHTWVSADHLFLAFLKSKKLVPDLIYDHIGVDIKYISSRICDFLNDEESNTAPQNGVPQEVVNALNKIVNAESDFKNLEQYAINLNRKAINDELDPVYGRDAEIEKLQDILNRRKKNNAIIVGEAGVGKTAIVEGLVQNIVSNKASIFLHGMVFYELNLSTMLAGTKYRGEFEERMKKIVKEAEHENIILFIDEVHTLVGAGDAEGGLDAANIFKPALANGSITVIGATTYKEYRQKIVKDKALQRRFEAITVKEPSKEETLEILNRKKYLYEAYHGVNISDEVLQDILNYSDRYLTNSQFPDKAIDLMDLACSHLKVKKVVKPKKLVELEQKLITSFAETNKTFDDMNSDQQQMYNSLKNAANQWSTSLKRANYKLTRQHVIEVLSTKTNIPSEEFLKSEAKKYLILESKIKSQLIGQDESVKTIAKCLMRHKSGLRDIKKPIGSFLCLGTTGVGKTFLAKSLTEHFFGSRNDLIHLDMSEYSEETSITKLIGSNPGYIGHEQGGLLIEKISNNPHTLILFDEIEKAHPKVHQMLLQILDEGRLTDSHGRIAYFHNSIVMVTGNIGSYELSNTNRIGFNKSGQEEDNKSDAYKELKKRLPLELINRFDDVLFFNKLTDENLKLIIKHEIKKLKDYASNNGITLNYANSVIEFIFNKISDKEFGARSIKRIVQKEISDVISSEIVGHPEITMFKIKHSKKDNKIVLEKH